jgi:hypothetical protein
MLANAALWAEEVRLDVELLGAGEEMLPGAAAGGGPAPAAHRGFLSRARAVPVEALYAAARARGKRLVLTGHSLGGAVAMISTTSLLAKLPRERHADVSCFAFAAPAVGNVALTAAAEEAGWAARVTNFLVPEDPVPRLLGSSPCAVAAREAAAAVSAAARAHPLAAAASNISAASGSLLASLRRAAPVAGGRGATALVVEEAPGTPVVRRAFLHSLVLGAAQAAVLAATAPARAAPRYCPLGRQLWIAPGGVVASAQLAAQANAAPCSAPPSAAPAPALALASLSASTLPTAPLAWAGGWRPPPAAAALGAPSAEEDNVDVAAAAALAAAAGGGLLPMAAPPGSFLPAHRMLTYRARLMAIAAEALGGAAPVRACTRGRGAAAGGPDAPPVWALPRGDDVQLSELLAPGVFPVSAAATPLSALPPAPRGGGSARDAAHGRRWRRALRRAPPAEDSARVDVAIRVEGRGLSNATAAWITGASTDASGRAAPLAVEIVARPAPPAPAAAGARAHPALEPIAAAASWVAQAAGWVPRLGRLQPAGSGDALLLRASLPGETLRRAAEAPRLTVMLRSDFGTHAVPLVFLQESAI